MAGRALATFAAGCFWGVEEAFLASGKVLATRVGYCGGSAASPTYRQVCTGQTGHAEAVEIVFDPARTAYTELLDVFWQCHNPTTRNRQGPDVGSQYRSAIFVHDEQQRLEALQSLARQQPHWPQPIVTEVVAAGPFYPAEEYHQQYLRKQGRAVCHI